MYPHLANRVFNRPHLMEPRAGRALIGALSGRLAVDTLTMPDGQMLDAHALTTAAASTPGRESRSIFEQVGDVAIIRATGTLVHRFGHLEPMSGMTGYDGLEAKIDAAMDDPSIAGVILDIDSPGGEVAGCFDLAAQIYAARQIKPIWALCDEMACSAAYALASAATRVIAPGTARVGSIGVLTAHVDQSAMLANEGLAVTLIYAGSHKVDANPYGPLPDDVRAETQAEINGLYARFTEMVATHRGMTARAVQATEARVYDAASAKAAGLIDDVMPARDVLAAFQKSLTQSATPFALRKERSMALFNRSGSREPVAAASLEMLVNLCSEHELPSLAKPLQARGVTEEQAAAIMEDAQDVRDRMAATFPTDMATGVRLADKFLLNAYSSETPRFGDAVGSLMVEVSAAMSGEELDNHPPPESARGGRTINAQEIYRRGNNR